MAHYTEDCYMTKLRNH